MICQLGHSAREVGTWLIGIALGDPGSASGNPTSRSCLLGNPSRVAETQIPGWVTGSEEGEGRNVIRQGKWAGAQAPRWYSRHALGPRWGARPCSSTAETKHFPGVT